MRPRSPRGTRRSTPPLSSRSWTASSHRPGRETRNSATPRRRESPAPREFLATERIVFFVRLKISELRDLLEATDCVYEFDFATPDVRGWLTVNDPEFPVRELRAFRWARPRSDAGGVVAERESGLGSLSLSLFTLAGFVAASPR